MSDTDSDEDTLCRFGTALTPYEKNEIPSKKPINLEDQIAKDENGRRRFHGAFTGGFSAGFWNTVGSQEGFTPNTFKSSRTEKGQIPVSKPTDFMDDEDRGEFGFAPQRIQAKIDFDGSGSNKRKLDKPSDGPIPGIPVLHDLLRPVHDKIAVRILKKMGWRSGQGVGARLTSKEKKRVVERNQKEVYLMKKYGCDMGPFSGPITEVAIQNQTESDDEDSDGEITFAPDDFDPYVAIIKENSFGLGYSGLLGTKENASSKHINLFQMVDRNNKKISISGQAFGVGALEEEDEDIYAPDDFTKYDRSLDDKKNKQRTAKPKLILDAAIVEGFAKTTINENQIKVFSVDLPRNFKPRDWSTRRSRFAPMDGHRAKIIEENNKYKVLGMGRHDLKPEDRGVLLNEEPVKINDKAEMEIRRTEREKEANEKRLEAAKKLTEKLMSKQFVSENNENFRPFSSNTEKQERYEKFVAFKKTDEKSVKEFFQLIQPLSMSSFEMAMEVKEFEQAKKMYKPLDAFMSNRFVTETDLVKEKHQNIKIDASGKKTIIILRTKSMWKPHKDLCKRFNCPEPFGGMMFDEEAEKKKTKQKSSLFDYIGVPLNTKSNFITPQIIPRHSLADTDSKKKEENSKKFADADIEKNKSKIQQSNAIQITAKEFFNDVPSTSKFVSKSNPSENFPKDESYEAVVPPKDSIENKTDLEIKVIESMHKKIKEKKDLFRAIFCESEEEEDKVDKIEQSDQKAKFIENFLNVKPASEINIYRNTSPPRGIFKNFLVEPKATTIIENDITENREDYYGPKLPDRLPTSSEPSHIEILSDLDRKILEKLKKKDKKVREKWVDKETLMKKKHKHEKHKKHKKEKKHKSKH